MRKKKEEEHNNKKKREGGGNKTKRKQRENEEGKQEGKRGERERGSRTGQRIDMGDWHHLMLHSGFHRFDLLQPFRGCFLRHSYDSPLPFVGRPRISDAFSKILRLGFAGELH